MSLLDWIKDLSPISHEWVDDIKACNQEHLEQKAYDFWIRRGCKHEEAVELAEDAVRKYLKQG